MPLKRRHFLLGSTLAVAGAGLALGNRSGFLLESGAPSFYSCCQTDSGEFRLSLLHRGRELYSIALPGRGHAVSARPHSDHLATVARRPGNWLQVVSTTAGKTLALKTAQASDYFNGHVRYTADGRYLLATQTEGDTLNGYIGIYDAADDYRYLGKWLTQGQDPHEIALMPDGKTLVIANGGYTKSHEDGSPLNLNEMDSSLVYMELASGKILQKYAPEHPWMSLRHLAVSPQGEVVIGVQYQGSVHDAVPLIVGHHGEDQLQSYIADASVYAAFSQYVASVAVDDGGRFALSTSPKKGAVVLWDMLQRKALQQYQLRDVAGAYWHAVKQQFVISNSLGQLMTINPQQAGQHQRFYIEDRHWDNHMMQALV